MRLIVSGRGLIDKLAPFRGVLSPAVAFVAGTSDTDCGLCPLPCLDISRNEDMNGTIRCARGNAAVVESDANRDPRESSGLAADSTVWFDFPLSIFGVIALISRRKISCVNIV